VAFESWQSFKAEPDGRIERGDASSAAITPAWDIESAGRTFTDAAATHGVSAGEVTHMPCV
jgi:hypothetical protein